MQATTTEPQTPVAITQEWYGKVQRELPRFLRAAWAQELMEAFERIGVRSADQITADALSRVATTRQTTVEGLLDSLKSCPFGFGGGLFK